MSKFLRNNLIVVALFVGCLLLQAVVRIRIGRELVFIVPIILYVAFFEVAQRASQGRLGSLLWATAWTIGTLIAVLFFTILLFPHSIHI